ncbi:uncharacterized protein TNCV_2104411 [Trichonephila clavipes]|nr:uncharacterized protein TNCV_2104411 [Trichonephila clavipes]
MAPHIITHGVGAVCRCKAKAGSRRSPRGLHTLTQLPLLLKLDLDSSLKTTWSHSVADQYLHSKRRRWWLGTIGSVRNGRRDTRCPSARRLALVREDTGARSEGAACVWTVANEAVGSTRACRMM